MTGHSARSVRTLKGMVFAALGFMMICIGVNGLINAAPGDAEIMPAQIPFSLGPAFGPASGGAEFQGGAAPLPITLATSLDIRQIPVIAAHRPIIQAGYEAAMLRLTQIDAIRSAAAARWNTIPLSWAALRPALDTALRKIGITHGLTATPEARRMLRQWHGAVDATRRFVQASVHRFDPMIDRLFSIKTTA